MENIAEILFFLGAIQGILLSLFLFTIKNNRTSNRLLAGLTLLWGIFLLAYALQFEGLYTKVPHLLKVFYQFLFLFFPLLYLYVKYLITDIPKFEKKDYLHFLPFLISVILYFDFFIQPADVKLMINSNKSDYYNILQIVGDEFIAFQGIIYSILSLIMISKYKKQIENYDSNINKRIIKTLYIGISLNLLSWIIGTIGLQFYYFHVKTDIDFFTLSYLIMVVIIYAISYVAIKSPEIFKIEKNKIQVINTPKTISTVLNDTETSMVPEKENISSKSRSNAVTDAELLSINKKLIEIMEKERPYLDPDLTLPELAKRIDVSRNHLSNVINQVHKVNFYQFINRYRVEEVKRLMRDPENKHIKLLSLAYDAGFNSKASFNRIFKQMTNMTPSEYYEKKKGSSIV
jgi:AraC-like DNA-binding protein